MTTATTGGKKINKEAARYISRYAGTQNRYCRRCTYFVARGSGPPGECRRVQGAIDPSGSCKLFEVSVIATGAARPRSVYARLERMT